MSVTDNGHASETTSIRNIRSRTVERSGCSPQTRVQNDKYARGNYVQTRVRKESIRVPGFCIAFSVIATQLLREIAQIYSYSPTLADTGTFSGDDIPFISHGNFSLKISSDGLSDSHMLAQCLRNAG